MVVCSKRLNSCGDCSNFNEVQTFVPSRELLWQLSALYIMDSNDADCLTSASRL